MGMKSKMSERVAGMWAGCLTRVHAVMKSTKGQGTTEYAILVGVFVWYNSLYMNEVLKSQKGTP